MNEELAREAVGLLGTAAATLIEAAHPLLVAPPATKGDCSTVARVLRQLAANLTALAGAGRGRAAHPLRVAPPAAEGRCSPVPRVLRQLASNLTALAGAAEVLARTSSDVTDR